MENKKKTIFELSEDLLHILKLRALAISFQSSNVLAFHMLKTLKCSSYIYIFYVQRQSKYFKNISQQYISNPKVFFYFKLLKNIIKRKIHLKNKTSYIRQKILFNGILVNK